jgi:hypothetical protein
MELHECISVLEKRGMLVERDAAQSRWLVFSTNDPEEIQNGGWPDFFDDLNLIRMVETFLVELPLGDCAHHPYLSSGTLPLIDSQNETQEVVMYHAYRQGDSTRQRVSISDWLVQHLHAVPMCPLCDQQMHLVGAKSTNVRTHFSHFPGAKCPTMATTGAQYRDLVAASRGTDAEATQARQFVLDRLDAIYEGARALCPELLWKEFLPLLDTATQERVWHLKDFDPHLAPYVLLCGAGRFAGKQGSKRPHDLFFVLEPGAMRSGYWNLGQGPAKRDLWRVDRVGGIIEPIPMMAQLAEPWYRKQARALLRLP